MQQRRAKGKERQRKYIEKKKLESDASVKNNEKRKSQEGYNEQEKWYLQKQEYRDNLKKRPQKYRRFVEKDRNRKQEESLLKKRVQEQEAAQKSNAKGYRSKSSLWNKVSTAKKALPKLSTKYAQVLGCPRSPEKRKAVSYLSGPRPKTRKIDENIDEIMNEVDHICKTPRSSKHIRKVMAIATTRSVTKLIGSHRKVASTFGVSRRVLSLGKLSRKKRNSNDSTATATRRIVRSF